MIDSIAIISGGMDSVTLLYYLVKRKAHSPALLTFVYGQKHTREAEFARYHARRLKCRDHRLLDLTFLVPAFAGSSLVSDDLPIPSMQAVAGDDQPSTYVPNRNMIFLSIAIAYAETRGVAEVYYGAQRNDLVGYWDTTPEFVDRMNATLQLNRRNSIQIKTPFVHYSKADILRLGFELGVDYGKTWSCFHGDQVACGVCPACVQRLQAFEELDIPDPLPYRQ